jgi:hypothetical protein
VRRAGADARAVRSVFLVNALATGNLKDLAFGTQVNPAFEHRAA